MAAVFPKAANLLKRRLDKRCFLDNSVEKDLLETARVVCRLQIS